MAEVISFLMAKFINGLSNGRNATELLKSRFIKINLLYLNVFQIKQYLESICEIEQVMFRRRLYSTMKRNWIFNHILPLFEEYKQMYENSNKVCIFQHAYQQSKSGQTEKYRNWRRKYYCQIKWWIDTSDVQKLWNDQKLSQNDGKLHQPILIIGLGLLACQLDLINLLIRIIDSKILT